MTEAAETQTTEDQAPAEDIQQEREEFEIKLDTPNDDRNKSPMIQRIIGQRNKARDQNEELKAKIERLEKQLTPQPQKEPPKLSEFSSETDYQEAMKRFYAEEIPGQRQASDPLKEYQRQQSLNSGLDKHYRKAAELAAKFPEYSAAEQAAAQTLGDELSQEVAIRAKNSAELMLFFGSNPAEAQRFKSLAEQDPVGAALELGRLDALVKIQSKTKSTLPEPDQPLGSTSGIIQKERGPEGATFT